MEFLHRYATGYHQWRQAHDQSAAVFYRPQGIGESAFDSDGIYHEGRADINMAVAFEIKTRMSRDALRRHIVLAWTNLRLRHTLLSAQATWAQEFMDDDARERGPRFFVVRRPADADEAVRAAQARVAFLDDHYSLVDLDELYTHAQNTARAFDADETLARLLVLPLERTSAGTYSLRFLFVMAHQISDGLTNNAWALDFMRLLNQDRRCLEAAVDPLLHTLHERLPLPQEDLYPPISGSRARSRWFWAISLILRHVQKPLPAAFRNPLRAADAPRAPTLPPTAKFDRVLDYGRPPRLNAGMVRAHVDGAGTRRLHRACRDVGCSIGAGCFVLVAMAMMALYEEREPGVPLDQRRPFIGSFPINPRPFFDHAADPDSMMLAFSDGVVLPFLPSHRGLDLDGRLRLLVRSAQRQLSRYQKRRPHRAAAAAAADAVQYMGPRGAGRVIAMNHLDIVERTAGKLPAHLRRAPGGYASAYAKQPNPTAATCGVSSVGRFSAALRPGRYDLGRADDDDDDNDCGEEEEEEQLVADIRGLWMGVRPRDDEFLVGIWGTDDGIDAYVSYDACAIDPVWADRWRDKIETMLSGGSPPWPRL